MVLILGIHKSHNSSVCLLKDGAIVASVQEEKFNRIKNSGIFPKASIDWVLRSENITPDQLDAVAVGGTIVLPANVDLTGSSVGNAGKGGIPIPTRIWRHVDYKHQNLRKVFYPLVMKKREQRGEAGRKEVREILNKTYGIPKEKVFFVDHHTCHAYTSYYGLRNNDQKNAIVLTLDGEGDYDCATVSKVDSGLLEKISTTPWYKSLGYIYSQTTIYLGMKALEHEYKVMGLAPYAKDYFKKTYEKVFKPTIDVNENTLEFTSTFPLNRFIEYLKETALGERFDNVAAGVQYLTEEVVQKWVKASMKKLDFGVLYVGGGVFMNVKMNLKLSELEEVEELHPFPSCGDESNPIGAAYYVYIHKFQKPAKSTKRVKQLYLGPSYSNEYAEELIKKIDLKRKYKVDFYKDIEGTIAEILAKGGIVARLAGKCEWGARSLGNRAILGDPSKMETFYTVNDQIKMRDFWMPFAPSIMEERQHDYIENPKNIDAPYMIMAFHSTQLAQKELRAGIHQADKTCRPQIVNKEWNPEYHRIIKEFEKETGIGAVLNTSFNLHGEPIVCSPEDAIHTLEDSGLQNVAIENYIISKK